MAAQFLTKDNVAIIFIDLQNGPLSTIGSIAPDALRTQVTSLAAMAVLFNLPVVLAAGTQAGPRGEVIDVLRTTIPTAPVMRHSTPNAFATPAFAQAVATTGRRNFILAGIATDVGVLLTALGLHGAGYQVCVAADVTGALTERADAIALARLQQAGIIVSTWASFAAEMQADFAGPQGSELLALMMPQAAHAADTP